MYADNSDIDTKNIIRQRSSSNDSDSSWKDGLLEKANLEAYDADRVAMKACWESHRGAIDVRLWYASSNTTIEEYLWRASDDEWKWQQTWTGYSGTAGIGCSSGDSQAFVFVSLVNTVGRLELWAMDRTADLNEDDTVEWENSKCRQALFS